MNNKTVQNWLNLAQYDIDTAKIMLDSNRYLYVCFMSQQAIEKILKAIYVKEIGETPPYTHNLNRLIERLSVKGEFDPEKHEFIDILNSFYIESRYTEEIDEINEFLTKEKAVEVYNKTLELFQWLKSKLKI